MASKTKLRQDLKAMEQAYMVMKDQYADLAQALGAPCDAWFGDPLVPHNEIVQRARLVVTLAGQNPLLRSVRAQ